MLVGAVMTAGCAEFRPISRPVVQVQAVQLAGESNEGARIQVTLLLKNPNQVALPLVSTNYRVEVPGVGGFAFGDDSNRTLPAGGTQTLVLPAAIATHGQNLKGAACQVSGSVSYNPPGMLRRLLTESGVPEPTTPFSVRRPLQ